MFDLSHPDVIRAVQAALAEPGQQLLESAGVGANALLAIQLRQTVSQQVNGTACLPDAVRFIRGTAASCLRFPASRSVYEGLKSGF